MTHDEIQSRDALIKAAKPIFAQKGLEGATVKEICDSAGLNVSLISYYFQGKEGLYRACLEQYGLSRLKDATRILKHPETIEEFKIRFRMFVEEHMKECLEESDLCVMIQHEISTDFKVAKDIFKNTFIKVFETFVEFFQIAKKKGFLKKDVDPLIYAGLVFGSVIHLIQNEHMSKDCFDVSLRDPKLFDRVMSQLNLILEGALK